MFLVVVCVHLNDEFTDLPHIIPAHRPKVSSGGLPCLLASPGNHIIFKEYIV